MTDYAKYIQDGINTRCKTDAYVRTPSWETEAWIYIRQDGEITRYDYPFNPKRVETADNVITSFMIDYKDSI